MDQGRPRAAKLHCGISFCNASEPCVACEGTHGQEWHSHLQHTSYNLQPALAFCAQPARNGELVEELAEEPVAMDGRKATGGAANLHAGGWSD